MISRWGIDELKKEIFLSKASGESSSGGAGAVGRRRVLSLLWPWGTLILLTLAAYLWGLGSYGLIDPDEGRYSEIPREMVESGDFVTPRLNYVKYFEKPALHYWLTAGAFLAFGQGEAASRATPVLMGLGGCLLTFLLARRAMASARAGGLAALILAASVLWFALSRLNLTDMTLTFFFTLALLGYRLWSEEGKRRWILLFYAGMALGTLTKGLVGVVLPGGIAVLHLGLMRRWRPLLRLFSPWGMGLYFLIAVPWFWAVCRANPDFFHFFFIREHFQRYLTTVHGRYQPFWFFIPIMLGAFVPWTGMLLDALHAARGKCPIVSRSDGLFLGLWFAVPFLFFSLSHSKLIPYVLPCMPPVAVLMGAAAETAFRRGAGSRWMLRRFVGLNALILLPLALAGFLWPGLSSDPAVGEAAGAARRLSVALLAFWGASLLLLRGRGAFWVAIRGVKIQVPPLLCILALAVLLAASRGFGIAAARNSQRDIAAMLADRLRKGDTVVAYRNLMQGLPFYLKQRVVTACELNELEFGAASETDPRWFIDGPQLRRLWNGPDRVLLAARRRDAESLEEVLGREPVPIGETPGILLFTNF